MNKCSNRGTRFAAAVILFATTLACANTSSAQSGRRAQTQPNAPSVSGARPPGKTPAAPRKLPLLVGVEDRNQFSNIPYYLSDTVLDACVDRLRDATGVSVSASARGMTRLDAVHRAKAETETYVVWLQIESEIPISAKQSKSGPGELYLRYTIFEPATARIKAEGRTQHQIYRAGGGGVSTGTSSRKSPIYSEYALKKAAGEAAERVMEAFEIELSSDGRGKR